MSDTIKIQRPPFQRRSQQGNGRVEHDPRGNAVWVRTRGTDSQELSVDPGLSIEDDDSASSGVDPYRKTAVPRKTR